MTYLKKNQQSSTHSYAEKPDCLIVIEIGDELWGLTYIMSGQLPLIKCVCSFGL